MTRSNSHTKGGTLHRPAVLAAALLLALAGCGGDGGGDSGLVALTTSNRDATAHATAASIGVLDASGAAQINAAGGDRARALAATARWLPGNVFDVVQRALAQSPLRSGMARPLALMPPLSVPCDVAGNVTVTIDDRDNSGTLTVGDTMGMVFSGCQDDASVVIDGQASATLTRITSDTSFAMLMSMQQISQRAVNGRHEMTVGGTVQADFETTSTGDRMTLVVSEPVTANLRTHLPYTDTVTLNPGFTQVVICDCVNGLTTSTTASGRLTSTAVGGSFDLRTVAPIVIGDDDPYPRSGIVAMTGSTGAMRLTAQSTSNVLVELDTAGDGIYEDRQVQTWDWLF